MPIGIVIGMDTEIGGADDFQVVGEAGMGDGEVVGGAVSALGVLIDEGRVGIVDDLGVAVILHHDDEDVIQTGNASWDGALLRGEGAD